MSLRAVQILEDMTVTIEGSKKVRTQYDISLRKHLIKYDLCNITVKLAATANPYPLEQHRKACKARAERLTARQYRAPGVLISNLCILPHIPLPMQAKIYIPRAEETVLGIKEELIMEARADFHLLNSDDFPQGVTDSKATGIVGKRARTETRSTIKPPFKRLHF